MKWKRLLGCCLFALVAATGSRASAQPDRASDTDARALFEQGRVAYDAGHFDDATRAFRRAYLLSPRFALLYNIGQAELRAGHDQLALEAFEGYLRQAPGDAPQRSEVEERVRVLRSMGVQPAASETLGTAPAETPAVDVTPGETELARASGGPGVAPWIVLGGGAAVLVGGVVMMIVGVSEAGTVTGAPQGSRWSDLEGSASSANVLWGVGLVLAGVGLAAVGVGLVWALSGGSEESPQAATARLRLGPGSLSLEGEF